MSRFVSVCGFVAFFLMLTGVGSTEEKPAETNATKWSEIVSAKTLENEVIRLSNQLKNDITTPVRFARGGHRSARLHFSELATLFALIHEHDGDVRWKDSSMVLRDRFSQAARNSKTGARQVYNEAKFRLADLNSVIGGKDLEASEETKLVNEWPEIVDRAALMKRNEVALQRILAWQTKAVPESIEAKEAITREAELIASRASIILKNGMDDTEDKDYRDYAGSLRDSARSFAAGAMIGDPNKIKRAAADLKSSCIKCHESFR